MTVRKVGTDVHRPITQINNNYKIIAQT